MSRRRPKILSKDGKLRIAVVVKSDDSGATDPQAVFAFKGAPVRTLHAVFNQLRGTMITDYIVNRIQMQEIINGRCPEYIEVTVNHPDFNLAAPQEWCVLIAQLLKRCVRCDVVICKQYERFLNL